MYLGRYQQGEEALILLLCSDSNDVPVAPDAAPRADVTGDATGRITGIALAVVEPAVATGLFYAKLYLDSRFTGLCTVTLRWLVSGAMHARQATFEVAPGSDASGGVLALYYYRRPHAEFLIQQRSGGGVFKGKNPRL